MKRALVIGSLALFSALAFALPSTQEVESAVKAGNYGQAETMMQEVVTAKPGSARAHYVYAEILAHEGKFAEAATQARTAQGIDPALSFTEPARFRSFEQLLEREQGRGVASQQAGVAPMAPAARPMAVRSGLPSWVWAAGIAVIAFLIFRAVTRRAAANRQGAPAGFGGAAYAGPGQAGYGTGYGMGGQPMGPMNTGAGGSMLRTGLAAAGGVAAGMLAEKYLEGQHHQADQGAGFADVQPNFDNGSAAAANELEQRQVDFGSGDGWGGGDAGGGGDGGSSGDNGGW